MTWRKVVYLYCDGGDDCPLDGAACYHAPAPGGPGLPGETIADQRRRAAMDGWVQSAGGKDFCPECKERGRD